MYRAAEHPAARLPRSLSPDQHFPEERQLAGHKSGFTALTLIELSRACLFATWFTMQQSVLALVVCAGSPGQRLPSHLIPG